MVDDARLRERQAKLPQQVQLCRLGQFVRIRIGTIDHRHTQRIQVPQPVQRVERGLGVPAQVRRGTRTIEHQRPWCLGLRWIEQVRGRIQSLEGNAASLQFHEEWTEPVRMFVIDRNRQTGHFNTRSHGNTVHTRQSPAL